MRILVAWADVTSYALAGWRALAAKPGVSLAVVASAPGSLDPQNGLVAPEDMDWLHLLRGSPEQARQDVGDLVSSFRPAVVLVSGWACAHYRQLFQERRRANWRLVLSMDSSLHRPVRQLLGRVRLSPILAKVDAFLVPGERGRELLCRWWKIPPSRVWSGLYAVDTKQLRTAYERRRALPVWPRAFQFVGRYVRIKGVEELLAGYERYRGLARQPMPLRFCGAGPLRTLIAGTPGVEELGFLQPGEIIETLAHAGCLVLPSRYDPWPLAIPEACAAGLPILASTQCGSAVELLRDGHNGLALRDSSPEGIAGALLEMHRRCGDWGSMGARSLKLVEPYSAESWADNVERLARHLAGSATARAGEVAPPGQAGI